MGALKLHNRPLPLRSMVSPSSFQDSPSRASSSGMAELAATRVLAATRKWLRAWLCQSICSISQARVSGSRTATMRAVSTALRSPRSTRTRQVRLVSTRSGTRVAGGK